MNSICCTTLDWIQLYETVNIKIQVIFLKIFFKNKLNHRDGLSTENNLQVLFVCIKIEFTFGCVNVDFGWITCLTTSHVIQIAVKVKNVDL